MTARPALTALAVASVLGLAAGCGGAGGSRPTVTVTAAAVTVTADPQAAAAGLEAPVGVGATTSTPSTGVTTTSEVPSSGATSPSTPPTSPSSSSTSGGMSQDELREAIEALDDRLTGHTGIALVPVGGGPVITAGEEQRDLAWSTIKVPITIAAGQEAPSARQRSLARRTITVSDNDAASAQWGLLGAGDTAAAKVDAVLRRFGDPTTSTAEAVSPAARWRFGATSWTVGDSALFAAHLPCRAEAAPVLDLMSQIDPSQRWGLGRIEGARFKGGWGPQKDGFVTRQLGVVRTPDGRETGVAIISRTDRGMDAATADLGVLADWVEDHLDALPAGRCS